MNYRKIVEGQIEELLRRQESVKDKPLKVDSCLKIAKTISELAALANTLPSYKED
ncbi:hypothetical protein CBC_A0938 [Clostridium botulinum C str. Eklund]|nr:hypothetical protein CBC_A0938 [Clostridium botulinum C str. Eklund]